MATSMPLSDPSANDSSAKDWDTIYLTNETHEFQDAQGLRCRGM